MALNHPALVAITPQTPHQNNNSFIKNIMTRSSFCGTPTSNHKSFVSNRKSWNGNGTLPLQTTNCNIDITSPSENPSPPVLATFKSSTGTFPRKSNSYSSYQREADEFTGKNRISPECDNNEPAVSNGNLESRNSFGSVENEILTPNGNTGVTAGCKGNEMRRMGGNGPGRRYAEVGNWSARSSTFLEPYVQGIGWKAAPESDRGQEDQSTEDDEQHLIKDNNTKTSVQLKKPFIFPSHHNHGEIDREHKSRAEQLRERFELKQASKRDESDGSIRNQSNDGRQDEVTNVARMAKELLDDSMSGEEQRRNSRSSKDTPGSAGFRPIPAADLRDSLSQSRESLSSRTSLGGECVDGGHEVEGGSDADGDCECDSSSGSSSGSDSAGRAPCDIGLLERLLRTHPVWFLPGIQRAGAFHLLQGKEEGNFVVRQSSQSATMALSVRLPARAGPYIEHYLIHASGGRIGLETSQNKFDNIPDLVAHYSQCCDELPVQLNLPRALKEAKNRQQLSSLALLGQEFWRYPMASPKQQHVGLTPDGRERMGHGRLGVGTLPTPTPMSQTPSDTSSSFSSFSNSAGNQKFQTPSNTEVKDANIVLNLSPVEGSCNGQPSTPGTCSMSTFKGNSSPPNHTISRSPANVSMEGFIRAPRPTPPNTLNLLSSTAHLTHQSSPTLPQAPSCSSQANKNLPPPPPPRWAKPAFSNPSEVQTFSPVTNPKNPITGSANITVTTTVTFSVHNQQTCHQLDELLSPNVDSNKSDVSTNNNLSYEDGHNILSNFCQTTPKRMSPDGECMMNTCSTLQNSLRRKQQNSIQESGVVSPIGQSTAFSPEPPKGVFSPTSQVVSPNGSNSATSGIFSPSQINSPLSNATISSKSGIFSPVSQVTSPALNKSELFSPLSRSSPISAKSSVFSPVSNQNSFTNNSAFNSPLMGKDRERILSPNTNTASTTHSGRSRRSKHSLKKESRHYQESDILESPGVYYRSSLVDKVSDYEDIWGPEHGNGQSTNQLNNTHTNSSGRSTFKPNKDALGSGMLISKRPDLLPDTLPKVTSLNNNILSPSSPPTTDNDSDKEHHQFIAAKLEAQQKASLQAMHGSTEQINVVIATTNSKGETVPKRPDKLNLLKNANEQMTFETNERLKQKDFNVLGRTDEEIERDNHKKNLSNEECLLLTSDFCNSADDELQSDKQSSPFYADPVDAIKEVVAPLVQRRRVTRGIPGVGATQRYSEPPTHGHPYLPLRDMHSIEELSPSSPNTSSSVDNLAGLKGGRPRGKAVQPPRIKPTPTKQDQTWTVDSSWEFISKQNEGWTPLRGAREGSEGAFPSLAEQQCRLEATTTTTGDTLTMHQVLAQRFPELNLSPYPTLLKPSGEIELSQDPVEETKGCRMSSYDNVENRLGAFSSQESDDGTVFSEPWDCSNWDTFLPPNTNNDEPLSLQSISHDIDDDTSSARERSITPIVEEPSLRLATISRAKSFRDRLDPLLAPPRLQALRGSRGRRGTPGAPGEAVRAYALLLAADKTTVFAQNVDNFISCTKESKETCPHVVMRNMRQFMSGMKNYLVKHGEREFEKEVEKERLKLKANEFLNLDSILEGVLHGAVVTPLRSHVYGLLADKFAKRGDVALLNAGMRTARTLPPLRLGIRPSVRVPSDSEMVTISKYFVKMQESDSPLEKLENLLAAISQIFNAMKSGTENKELPTLGADDFLPVLVLTLARCCVSGAELEAELMAGLLPPPLLAGEGGYYLTTLFGAVAVLKRLASPEDQNKSYDWRTGSLSSGVASTSAGPSCSSGGGVARVLVPDESSGALRCVALPWRPGARARDMCRVLAHRARITNPQDYGLFALRDGEETLINDTDYPQEMVDNNRSHCMLAYKRIDAKIAWPKQALQSFP